VEDAYWWYERQRSGLGLEFLLAFDAAVERLRRLPEGHELVARRTRKALLRRFPYLVLYAVEAERVLITAVFHARRDPRRWSIACARVSVEWEHSMRRAFPHNIRLQRAALRAAAEPER
jgi:plasmid stabilization system protein ParE